MSTPSFLRVIADLFPSREIWLLSGVFATALVSAAFQTLGVASILPFMTLVLDPGAMDRYAMLSGFIQELGATSSRDALLIMGILTAVVVALGNAAGALNLVAHERFTARTSTRIARSLVAGYLGQPYAFHVQRDAPSLMKIVLTDVRIVMSTVVTPFLLAVSRMFVVAGLLGLLFLQDPFVTVTIAAVLGVSYILVYRFVRTSQRRIGMEMNAHNLDRQRVLQEGLGGIKDLHMLGREEHVLRRFTSATAGAAVAESSNRIVGALPRYVLETVAFGGILLVTIGLLAGAEQSAVAIVPILALYAFAGYRLLPALQQIFTSAVTIRFYQAALRELHADFVSVQTRPVCAETTPVPEMHFRDSIQLDKVCFAYAGSNDAALKDVSLVIRPRQSIGLVGRTGAGKTTLADLILGLYQPRTGSISVDAVPLTELAVRLWRRRVGYVPQQVFLANASVAENIAFALPPDEIDIEAVKQAARLAQADEFISALPDGFNTLVGERGVKLSGGQRQRIGIARALYQEPEVLVFDEATSALDGLTEDAVMQAIRSLSGERTIILIAHRLRTVEACDRIIMLEAGRTVADGTYNELMERSRNFRAMVSRTGSVGANAA